MFDTARHDADLVDDVLQLALSALRLREWTPDMGSPWSPTCLWCGGYMRTPAMDQDYNGKAGHKENCIRELAIRRLEELRK